jgi:ribonucleoside-diphosphate reductase alpha chain
VDNASYPTPAIGQNSRDYRPLGLGYANLGALLMSRGLPYDSDAGRDYSAAITAVMHGAAYAQSARVARDHGGPFPGFAKNREPMLRVMRKHRAAIKDIDRTHVPKDLFEGAKAIWNECVELGEQHGYRNAQATVLAPTGTIGFMMDCDTTGVEPDIALVKYKKLVGGGLMKIVNGTVPMALTKLGYTAAQVKDIIGYIDEHETIEGAPHLKDTDLPVFDCAFKPSQGVRSIHYMGHIKMMGATQPFISGAISKTVNVPKAATVEEIEQAYIDAWRIGAKAVSIYRDGSKRTQPLNTARDKTPEAARGMSPVEAGMEAGPRRHKLADERPVDHAQVRHRRSRGLHHGRPLRGRPAGRTVPDDGEGRLHDFGLCRRVRPGNQLRAAVRRAAAGPGRQIQPRPVRTGGDDAQPGHPVRQVHRRLHLPMDGGEVPVAGKRSAARA